MSLGYYALALIIKLASWGHQAVIHFRDLHAVRLPQGLVVAVTGNYWQCDPQCDSDRMHSEVSVLTSRSALSRNLMTNGPL